MQFPDVLKRNIKAYARESIYTALPAKILQVNLLETEQTVDVIPTIPRRFEDGTLLNTSTIEGVPVVFPSGGKGLLSFPLAVGDTVLLVFSMRSLSEWLVGTGDITNPENSRSHNLTDAIAIPGLYTFTTHLKPNPKDVELKFKDELFLVLTESGDIRLENSPANSEIILSQNGEIKVSNGNGYVTLGSDGVVTINGATIGTDGKITSPTGFEGPSALIGGKELKNHTHPGVQSGTSNTGPNQ